MKCPVSKLSPRRLGWVDFGDGVAGEGGSSPSPAHLYRSFGRQGCPGAVIATQAMRSVGEAQSSIQVLVHHHLATCQRRPPAYALDLQTQILKTHRVVAVHRAFELQRENPFQITTSAGHKSIAPLPGRDLKTAIELGDVIFPQKSVRCL